MAITQEFNGDILVDGNVSSDTITAIGTTISGALLASSASISGGLSANTANINGAVTANYLGSTGNATNQTMSQLAITNAINNAITSALMRGHPIGTYYISDSDTSPASLFGGSWQALHNVFLYASGKYSVGTTGGEEAHVLTIAELARHQHILYDYVAGSGTVYGINRNSMTSTGSEFQSSAGTGMVGANAPHNNMPPFLVVNMWKRVA